MSLFYTPLNHFIALAVIGEKAESFLQGQLTCNIKDVSSQQSRYGAHCSLKGKILFSLRVVFFQQQFYLILPKDNAEFAIQQLRKYAQLSRVTLSIANDIHMIGCWGDTISHHPQFSQLPAETDQVLTGENWIMIRERGDLPRLLLFGHQTELQNLLTSLKSELTLATQQDWALLDIRNHVAHIYPLTRDLFTPHMLDYPRFNAVSFKKGCYIGQEIIARTHYLGKAKRHLQLAKLPNECLLMPGEKLVNANKQEVGVVIEAIATDEKQIVLAVIQDEALQQEIFCQESQLVL